MNPFRWLRNLWRGPERDMALDRAIKESQYTATESLGTAVRRQEAVSRLHEALNAQEQKEIQEARRRLYGRHG